MSSHPAVRHLAPSEGKALRVGSYGFSFKAGRTTGSSYSLAEVSVAPGSRTVLHSHPREETMYVVTGDFEFFGEAGETRRAHAGAVMHVPANAIHGFQNVGDTIGRLLVVIPVAQEAFFDELAEAMQYASLQPDLVDAAFARHQVETYRLQDR
jgi:quercetin dioxygenase-like cupin family protein